MTHRMTSRQEELDQREEEEEEEGGCCRGSYDWSFRDDDRHSKRQYDGRGQEDSFFKKEREQEMVVVTRSLLGVLLSVWRRMLWTMWWGRWWPWFRSCSSCCRRWRWRWTRCRACKFRRWWASRRWTAKIWPTRRWTRCWDRRQRRPRATQIWSTTRWSDGTAKIWASGNRPRRWRASRRWTTPIWPPWRRCASRGSRSSTCCAFRRRPTSGSSSRAAWTWSTCWPSCPTSCRCSSSSPTSTRTSSRTCGAWCRSFASCASCASWNWRATRQVCRV